MNPAIYDNLPYPQTTESAKQWFYNHGIPMKVWAEAHGFTRFDVIDVLNGRVQGRYGKSHRVAIALGLKQDTAVTPGRNAGFRATRPSLRRAAPGTVQSAINNLERRAA